MDLRTFLRSLPVSMVPGWITDYFMSTDTVLLPAACPSHDPFPAPFVLGQCHNLLDTHKSILSTQYHNLHIITIRASLLGILQ